MVLVYNQKIYQEIIENFEEKFYPIISGAVAPFSKVYEIEKPQYIYKRDEKIPFNERHPKYQKILIAEFTVD